MMTLRRPYRPSRGVSRGHHRSIPPRRPAAVENSALRAWFGDLRHIPGRFRPGIDFIVSRPSYTVNGDLTARHQPRVISSERDIAGFAGNSTEAPRELEIPTGRRSALF